MNDTRGGRAATIVVGLLLIILGAGFLVIQLTGSSFPFDLGSVGWPLFIIVPGAILLLAGLFLPAASGVGLSVAGGIVTAVGLILAYQSAADHYESWAYAWALLPSAAGFSMSLWGILHRSADVARSGLAVLGVGLAMFLIGFGFFEGIIGIGGDSGLAPLGRQALPLALIVVGLVLIATRLWPRRRGQWASSTQPAGAAGQTEAPIAPVEPASSPDAAAGPEVDR